ncbi:Retrovirus-related Pol polyprotein from transposon 17.6 [Stylophora pistillata]|uniref:Retrovirus-related Pol polyprotein from transposon 17.6 n=1 Tax=Stylophora pistillata TaxID=50429 RepID=A0A2B4S4P3_STYPI|nr:Retrovirus-related Pol polyprotein from transposon 17.6 [Stylophora pistillata]
MSIYNTDVKFQLDSGATCNVITSQVLRRSHCDAEITQTSKILSMYNGTTVKPEGHCKVKMTNPKNGRRYLVNFEVLPGSPTPILGNKAIQQIVLKKGLEENIQSLNVEQTVVTKDSLLKQYPQVFEGIRCMPGNYHLTVDSSVKPVVHPPRRVALSLKVKVEAELQRLTELEIIEPLSKPAQWVSSMVTAPKPNGDIRICIDPKDLNCALQRSHCPIPAMDVRLPRLNKAKFSCTVDLRWGFWQADPEKIRAITEMPKPTDIKGVQRFLGLVNYLSKFLPKVSEVCKPLGQLTLKETEWCWLEVHDKVFQEIKLLVTDSPVLRYYQPEEELTLKCDASDKGLGAALLQQGQPIAFASRALTACEMEYVPIEKKLLAVVYGMERFHYYTYGRRVVVNSDHKPLESIVRKPLHMAPKRLQRILLRLHEYDVNLRYLRVTEMFLTDTLSRRAYLTDEAPSAFTEELTMINATNFRYLTALRLQDIAEHSKKNLALLELDRMICSGWPAKRDNVEPSLIPYFNFRNEFAAQQGVIYIVERVVIPLKLRKGMIKLIHSSHIGIEGCLRRARVFLYWPGMDAQVKNYIQSCKTCLSTGSKQQRKQ